MRESRETPLFSFLCMHLRSRSVVNHRLHPLIHGTGNFASRTLFISDSSFSNNGSLDDRASHILMPGLFPSDSSSLERMTLFTGSSIALFDAGRTHSFKEGPNTVQESE